MRAQASEDEGFQIFSNACHALRRLLIHPSVVNLSSRGLQKTSVFCCADPPIPKLGMNFPEQLPIEEVRQPLKAALQQSHRLILSAPTGSGKSTQILQMLLDEGLIGEGEVVVLQPRRLAARMLATRVAQERQGPLGRKWAIKFALKRSSLPRHAFDLSPRAFCFVR